MQQIYTAATFGKELLRAVLPPGVPTGTVLYEASVVKSDEGAIFRGSNIDSNYSNARPRFFRLFRDRLYYWEKEADAQNQYRSRGSYSLRDLAAVSTDLQTLPSNIHNMCIHSRSVYGGLCPDSVRDEWLGATRNEAETPDGKTAFSIADEYGFLPIIKQMAVTYVDKDGDTIVFRRDGATGKLDYYENGARN